MIVEPGQVVMLVDGEYDDYDVIGLFRARKRLDLAEEKRRYLQIYNREKARFGHWYHAQPGFIDWLCAVRDGELAERVTVTEVQASDLKSYREI